MKKGKVFFLPELRQDECWLSVKSLQASDVIEELEQCVSQLKQQLLESEHQRQQQLRVSPDFFTQEK